MKKLTLLLLFLTAFTTAFGQSPRALENELINHIKKINSLSPWDSEIYEQIERENNEVLKKLLRHGRRGEVLKYEFPDLRQHLTITTSDDGRFRAYTWNTNSGGTMVYYKTVYQFVGSDGGVYTDFYRDQGDGDPGSVVTEIIQFPVGKQNYYLLFSAGRASNIVEWQYATFYRIVGSRLDLKPKIIKLRRGYTNIIELGYDNRTFPDRISRPLIIFDRKAKTIRFPIIVEDEALMSGRITKRSIIYRFNGRYFVRVFTEEEIKIEV
jgi:hypothetical protein